MLCDMPWLPVCVSLFIPKLMDGVEVMDPCRSVRFHFMDLALCRLL